MRALYFYPDPHYRSKNSYEVLAQNGLRLLSYEFMLLHMCLHFEKHMSNYVVTLYWLCDLFEFLRKFADVMDWEKFRRVASHLAVEDKVFQSLGLMSAYFGLDLANPMRHSNSNELQDLHLALDPEARAEERLRHHIRNKQKKFQTLCSEYGLRTTFYYIFRTLFPSKKHVINRYGETSQAKFFGYYLLHIYERLRNVGLSAYMNLRQ